MTTAPTELAVSLCEAKDHCRIDTTDEDTYVADLIRDTTDYAQRATGHQFVKATYTTTIEDGFPTEIILDHPPVHSVTSVKYYDTAGEFQTLSADQYSVVDYGLIGKIVPAYGMTWPSCRALPNSVEVIYIAGYDVDDLPYAARRLILFISQHWNENREAVVTGTIASILPLAAESLIYQLSIPEIG